MEEALNSIFLWLANLWVSLGRLTDYTFHTLVFVSRLCSAGGTGRDGTRTSTATWEVPCEETHRVRH